MPVRLPGRPRISYLDAWAATARGVYFTAATRQIRVVTTLPKPPVPGGGLGIAVSPDERWLLYTQNGEAHSDPMLME